MRISEALSADLEALGEGLDASVQSDLEESIHSLKRDAQLAVRSLLGLTITVTSQDEPVTLTEIEEWVEPSDIRSSFEVTFTPASAAPAISVITLYAEQPDAFSELAEDLSNELEARPPPRSTAPAITVRLDSAPTPALPSRLTGLSELSVLNRALGILIGRGYSLDQALHYLSERAATPADRLQVAAELLTEAQMSR